MLDVQCYQFEIDKTTNVIRITIHFDQRIVRADREICVELLEEDSLKLASMLTSAATLKPSPSIENILTVGSI
jgi:hypothetical protein